MKTLDDESSIVMKNAVQNGVINTVLSPFGNPFVAALLDHADRGRALDAQNPNTFEAFEHPKSQRWQDSSLEPVQQLLNPDPQAPNPFFMAELARFAVPKGQVGFIRKIEQVINDVDGAVFPTNQTYWGSPVFGVPDIDNCRWYLTLDFFAGILPPRFRFDSLTPFLPSILPGRPYPDMFEIPALWYPANSAQPELKLIVPGNRILRLFFYTPFTTFYRWQVRGRLAGFTQSTYCMEATENARILS